MVKATLAREVPGCRGYQLDQPLAYNGGDGQETDQIVVMVKPHDKGGIACTIVAPFLGSDAETAYDNRWLCVPEALDDAEALRRCGIELVGTVKSVALEGVTQVSQWKPTPGVSATWFSRSNGRFLVVVENPFGFSVYDRRHFQDTSLLDAPLARMFSGSVEGVLEAAGFAVAGQDAKTYAASTPADCPF